MYIVTGFMNTITKRALAIIIAKPLEILVLYLL
jgi:hypothetical protein